MGDFVTFFRNRDLDSGREHKIKMQDQQSLYVLHVYTRTRADLSSFNDGLLRQKGVQAVFGDLKREIAGTGGGGVIANASDTSAQITLVGSQGYRAPSNYTLLQPGFPPQAVPAGSDKIPLPEAGHLIVPVDQAAQSSLEEMLGFLRWYSPDVESQVLDAIRQPSLDARVANLEDRLPEQPRATQLPGAAAAKKSSKFRQLTSWTRRTLANTRLGGPILTALLLAALVLSFIILDSRLTTLSDAVESLQIKAGIPLPSKETTEPEEETTDPPEAAADPPAAATDPPATADRSTTATNQRPAAGATTAATDTLPKRLILAVRSKAPNEPTSAAGVLWRTHFSEINDAGRLGEWTEEQQKRLYTDSTFLWGAMKLAIAQSGAAPASQDYLLGIKTWTATKDVLREVPPESFDQKTLAMFAACGCRIFPNRNRPSIRPTKSGQNPEILFGNKPCQSYTDAQIDAGLQLILQRLAG